jgi:hypothetical protein
VFEIRAKVLQILWYFLIELLMQIGNLQEFEELEELQNFEMELVELQELEM